MLSEVLFSTLSWENALAFSMMSIALLYMVKKQKNSSKGQSQAHEEPQIQGVNRLPAHAALAGFVSEMDARKYVAQPKCSPFVRLLNGYWHFQLYESVDAALAVVGNWEDRGDIRAKNKSYDNLKSNDKAIGKVETVSVPGHWQLQVPGDAPIYTNIKYIIPVDPPHLPKYNPTGYYHFNFAVSSSWSSRRNILCFGGVDSAFYVWCNKKFVGFSKDSRLPAEFDISNILYYESPDLNELEVVVIRYSDGFYLEDQDMFNLSGIFRDVSVISLPNEIRIEDFYWTTAIDSNTQIAAVTVHTMLRWNMEMIATLLDSESTKSDLSMNQHMNSYMCQLRSDWIVDTKIFEEGILVSSWETPTSHNFCFDNPSQNHICAASEYAPVPSLDGKGEGYVQQVLTLNSPNLWSAERPHVYTLVVSLRNARDGLIMQAESCRLAFRTIDISNGLLRLNQRPLLIRGVNYHEHDPTTGHTIPQSLVEADIKLMKRNNFNAVRLSHYPQAPWVYELCTVYGLYVADEANIETHGMKPYIGRLADDPSWEDSFMLRFQRMYDRDRVHPCIVFWSLGNESGYGKVHDKMAAWIRSRDHSRILMYEPASYGPREDGIHRTMATDILCPMYARVEDAIKLANIFPDYPLIQCEYAHMMGNSGGNFNEYWESFHRFPRLQGGFIWDWVDQGISIVDSKGSLKWAYGGDFGEIEHDANFCLNGLNWPDRGLGWVTDRGKPRDRSKWGKQRANMSINKPCYGLSGATVSDIENILNTSESVNYVVEVDGAMAKPVLLEAKQCQKYFECRVIGMKMPGNLTCSLIETDDMDGMDGHRYICLEYGSTDDEYIVKRDTSTPKRRQSSFLTRRGSFSPSYNEGDAFMFPRIDTIPSTSISITLRFSIINKYDMIDDIQTELEFYSFLLCDGIVVSDSYVKTLTSGYVHRDNSSNNPNETGTGRHSIQELECEGSFSLKFFEISKDLSQYLESSRYAGDCNHIDSSKGIAIFGSSWSQYALLNAEGIDKLSTEVKNIRRNVPFVGMNQSDQELSNEISGFDMNNLYWTNLSSSHSSNHSFSEHDSTSSTTASILTDSSHHSPIRRDAANENWSVVVIGRLANHTAYATKAYPVGFVESNVSKLVQKAIGPVLQSNLTPTSGSNKTASLNANPSPFETNISSDTLSSLPVTDSRPLQQYNRVMSHDQNNLVQVQYIPQESMTGDETDNTIYDANILLHTEVAATPLADSTVSNSLTSSKTVQVIISGVNGMIESLRVNDHDILCSSESLRPFGNITPSRIQFHRALTDNDKYGYKATWNAVGLTSGMIYKSNLIPSSSIDRKNSFSEESLQSKNVEGKHVFSNITVERISEENGSQGVKCSWVMEPSHVDRSRVRIIKQIQAFLDDPSTQGTVVYARNSSEEKFVHELAGIYRIGRESLKPSKDFHFNDSKGIRIRVWKVALHMCSTIPRAELLAGGGPIGVLEENEDKTPIELMSPSHRFDEDIGSIGPINVSMIYLLSPTGELTVKGHIDASKMIVPLPRIGMQFQVKSSFTKIAWRGCGPHECYPDRKASCISAVHGTSMQELYTPYIVPSENGSRTMVSWVQLEHRPLFHNSLSDIAAARVNQTEQSIWSPRNSYLKLDGLVPNPNETPNRELSETSIPSQTHHSHDMSTHLSTVNLADGIPVLRDTDEQDNEELFYEEIAPMDQGNDANDFIETLRGKMPSPIIMRIASTSTSSNPFNFSAQSYTTEDLSLATHSTDLEYHPRPFTSLNIDPFIMGIGGDDSWTACVHEEYLLPPEEYSYGFTFSFHS